MNTSNIDDLFPCISCGVNADPADGFGKCTCGNEAKREAIQQELLKARLEGQLIERTRWITNIQQKVLTEISATLSPRITDLINNTGLGNGTVQKALKRLIEVKLVRKIDGIYYLYESSMFMCEFGCKDAGLHYHDGVQAKLKGDDK